MDTTRRFRFCLFAARLGLCGLLAAGLLSLALARPALAVDCVPADISLITQAEVDAFPAGCNVVTGNLFIGSATDITDLSPLSGLTSVGGAWSLIPMPP